VFVDGWCVDVYVCGVDWMFLCELVVVCSSIEEVFGLVGVEVVV